MPILGLIPRIRSWLRRPVGRRPKALGLALLGVCAAGSQRPAGVQESVPRSHLSLDADDIEYSQDGATADLTGHVRLRATGLPGSVPEATVETDRMRVSFGTGDVTAGPRATLSAPRIRVSGDDLWLNLRSQDFRAANARTAVQALFGNRELMLYSRSASAERRQGRVELLRTHVSSCDRDRPHYSVQAKRIEVEPDQRRVVVRGGSVQLYGVRMPLVGRFSGALPTGRRAGGVSIPFPGYSTLEGVFVPYVKSFSAAEDPLQVTLRARLNQRSLLTGTGAAEYTRPGCRLWAFLARHQEVPDDIHRRLLHDAVPELGAELSRTAGASTYSARLTAGRYRDEDPRARMKVTDVAGTLRLDWTAIRRGADPRRSVWTGAGVRGSVYGNGDAYHTVDVQVGHSFALWPRARAEVELSHHFIGGRTPFEFDDIDLRTEAYVGLDTPLTRSWSVEATGRYDVDRGEVRDYVIDLRRRVHCLTWHLIYRLVGSQIGVNVELTDLVLDRPAPPGGSRGKPAQAAAPCRPREASESAPRRPEVAAEPVASPLVAVPTEFQQTESARQRAPDAVELLGRRPPPSLRLASAGELR